MATLKKLATSLFVALLLSVAASVALATSGLPMLKTSISSGDEYARRLEVGDVNGSPILVAQALKLANRITNVSVTEAAEYLSQTQVRPCPLGTRKLSSVLLDGQLGTVSRSYKDGESCLWDRNTGLVVGSTSCGNIDMEVAPGAEEVPAQVGPQGERGPPGRDGYVVVEGNIQVLEYDQATPTRMSDRARVEITNTVVDNAFDTIETGIIVAGLKKFGSKYIDGQVRREEIRAYRDVEVARWNSQRGPSELTVNQFGNCNAAFGSTTNCPTTNLIDRGTDRPTTPVPNPNPNPTPTPLPTRPRPSEPILGRPRASEPISGSGNNGMLPQRQQPGSSGGDTGIGPRIRPRDPNSD